ncbi:hypothetical protein LguiA_035193 [Lonicera macranthoides]
MGGYRRELGILSPSIAPISSGGGGGGGGGSNVEREEHWRNFGNSVDSVSFGFVATAILISMFLVMALFERFYRPRSTESSGGGRNSRDVEAQKLDYPSPKMAIYARGVSVLMPGEEIPTFIAHPAPALCLPEPISRPLHQHYKSTEASQSLNESQSFNPHRL